MKLAFTNLACPDWDLETIAAKAAEYGYDGVELRSHSDNKLLFPNPPLSHRRYVKSLFDKYNLDICCVSAYSRFATGDVKLLEENKQILVDDILLARDLGAPVVRSFLGENKELTHREIINHSADYLNYCGDLAHALGIKVVFETHDAWCSGALMKMAFEKITSEGAAVLWDLVNNQYMGESAKGFFDAVGERCAHVHIKDSTEQPDGAHKYCYMGDGTAEAVECVNLLRGVNYQGYITFEWEKRWHPEIAEPEDALPRFVPYMRSII